MSQIFFYLQSAMYTSLNTYIYCRYTDNTFTLTSTPSSMMTFNFYGSSIGVFGARRSNHGNYVVQLDGNSSPTLNGQSSSDMFNQTLYSTNMSLGAHQLTVVNEATTYFDIDYVSWFGVAGKQSSTYPSCRARL